LEYDYDDCSNGAGFLCFATSTDAVTAYVYNARGGIATSTVTIDGLDYATGYLYDRQGNQTYIVYPDSSKVAYTYNTAGLLEQVSRKEKADTAYTSVITDFDYSPSGQVTLQAYYNGAKTTRTYDRAALYRLKHLKTEFPGAGGAGLDEDGGYLIEIPTTDALHPPLNLAERVSPRQAERREEADTTEPVPEEIGGEDPVSEPETPVDTEEENEEEQPETDTLAEEQPQENTEPAPAEENTEIPVPEVSDTAPNDESLPTILAASEKKPGRGYPASLARRFVRSAEADVLASLGVPIHREVNVYEHVPLSAELQDELETRSWNRITRPLEATVVKRESWNALDTIAEIAPTKFESEFHGKWINYLAADGWRPIDTTIATSSDGALFEMRHAPFEAEFPRRSTGTARMINNNRWDVFKEKEIATPPITMALTAIDVADVEGRIVTGDLHVPAGLRKNISYVLYENAYPDGDLIYYVDHARAPRLAKLVRINQVPSQLEYAFDVTITGSHTLHQDNGRPHVEASKDRGFGFKPFSIWDSSPKDLAGLDVVQEIDVTWEKTGEGAYRLTKVLLQSFFDTNPVYPVYTDTTSTFYPDPDTESTSVDGYVWRNDVAQGWAAIHDAASGTSAADDLSAINVSISTNTTSGQWDRMGRGFILFDTSSITDTDVVSSATFSIDGDGGTDAFDQSGCVVDSSPASNTSLSVNDYDNIGTTLYANCLDLGSWSTAAYNDFSLNATGMAAISTTGVTKFGWRLSSDRENSEPTWASDTSADASPHSADVAGTSIDPKLVVEHAEPNLAPTAPTSLLTEGLTNPTTVSDPTPEFSAIYNDPNAGDLAPWYRIQVSTSSNGDWLHAYWDSGTSTMATTTESNRSPDIIYAGSSLASSTTYYWRIRFSDDAGKEGAWSTATSTFKLAAHTPTPASAGGIQNLTYSYDNVGNIVEIIDASDTDTYKTVTYSYDNLYRLKSATSTNATTTQSDFTRTYSYSSIGNITNKSDVGDYTYAETGYANPHAATSINGATQTYSNSGNLLSNGTWNYRYNHRGQLVKATTTSAVSNFGYDHAGQRVFLKEGSTATTTFASKLYSQSSATTTKHIFANGQLIATIEGNDPGVGGAGLDEDPGFFIALPETITLSREQQEARETRGWNAITRPVETDASGTPTKRESAFHSKWINYLGEDNQWHEINSAFVDKGTHFEVREAPFTVEVPKTAAGTATFISNNRWDIFEETEITDMPFTQSIRAWDVSDVPGVIETGDLGFGTTQYVVYKDAYPFGDLIYWVWQGRAPRLKKIVRFTSTPAGDLSLAFELSYSENPTMYFTKDTLSASEETTYQNLLQEAREAEGTADGYATANRKELAAKDVWREPWDGSQPLVTSKGISHWAPSAIGRRGVGLNDFTFWYLPTGQAGVSNGVQQTPIEIEYKKTGDATYTLRKHIPLSLFDKATLPAYADTETTFYPDPDTESTSVDGYVWRNAVDQTWSAIHDAASGTDASDAGTATNMGIRTSTTNTQWQRMSRAFTLFDTSSLPDDEEITAATLNLRGADDNDNFSQSIAIVTVSPASNTSLSTSDYDDIGTTDQASRMTVATWANGSYNTFNLNATGLSNISKTGITKFGQRLSSDADNSAPTWVSDTQASAAADTADVAGTSQDPYLTVTHVPENQAPTAPTSLQTEGFTNPIDITDSTPEFSAIYNDPDEGDLAPYYRLQVSTSSLGDWAHAYWDSGTSSMATTTESNRSPELSYAGSALASSTTYYWRIRFSDDDKKEGAWSTATSTFSLSDTITGGTPPELCQCATSTIYYIHTDHLSGSSAITNDNDELVQTLDYYPFGSLRVNNQAANFNERKKFTGYEFDSSTGLNYAGARYQNPSEGRFTSQDPVFRDMGVDRRTAEILADPQQLNSYSYVANNPLKNVDVSGEKLFTVSGGFSVGFPILQNIPVLSYLSAGYTFSFNYEPGVGTQWSGGSTAGVGLGGSLRYDPEGHLDTTHEPGKVYIQRERAIVPFIGKVNTITADENPWRPLSLESNQQTSSARAVGFELGYTHGFIRNSPINYFSGNSNGNSPSSNSSSFQVSQGNNTSSLRSLAQTISNLQAVVRDLQQKVNALASNN